ncbi:MAG: hypothetical protein WCS79_07525 [Paludibacter sp.]
METDNEAYKKNNDKLRAANEEKKKKITEEFGAFYSNMSSENELPPEIESLFLDNVMAFENAFQDVKLVQLYDYLGNPPFRKLEVLKEDDLADELIRITQILDDHQVCLDTICEVPDRELYRFITEELFLKELEDIHIPGMFTNFIYEDFYPNHEHDIREHSTDFLRLYLDKDSSFYTRFLTSEAEKADWHIHFREAFSSFQLNRFNIAELNFDTDKAKVLFECDFAGKVEGSVESLYFSGTGEFNLLYQWDYWCIDSIRLPKILSK